MVRVYGEGRVAGLEHGGPMADGVNNGLLDQAWHIGVQLRSFGVVETTRV